MKGMTASAIALVLLLLGATALPVLAQNGEREIRALLDERDREIKALLGPSGQVPQARRDQLKTVINDVIDFRAMARTALGTHWSDLTATQQNEFVDVFSEIVRSQSLSDLDVYRSEVAYDRIDVSGSSAHVSTSVTYKNVPTRVEYAMTKRDGSWHVDDIILDRVSTAEGYARSFQPVVKKRGFDALMTSLRKKLDQVSQTS